MKTKRTPVFACQECGKKFYTVKSAERAWFGDRGCPKCGGIDIDLYVDPQAYSEAYSDPIQDGSIGACGGPGLSDL